ncbi:MAG: Npt1/Npt2 family nucleotide transporter [Candidatus Omnitrophica bacterium]|nr:Npt1/Npt2 family nucleotide transporter [Candidatus Omnitrophota bacterium]MDD5670180.1 Npt1/Npt2 family nucleotide transporter [Candidatus Omnitrophota bacterium]
MIYKLSRLFALLVKPIVEIRPNERMKALLMFGYFFLTIALVYILKPVRNSLFIDELGARNLRYVYMGEGVLLAVVVWAYVSFAKRVSKRILYAGVLGFFISNLILFFFLIHMKIPYISAYFYIWVASFSITMTTQFWTLANDIFNPIEAKRLFGLIISGGSLGGILGGLLTQQAVRWMPTEDLLLLAAGIVGLCILLIGALWKEIPDFANSRVVPSEDEESMEQPASDEKQSRSTPKILFKSTYLMMLVGLIILAKVASTVVDNQFNGLVEVSIAAKDARTAFFGGFMAWLNAASFIMQILVTSLALRYLGVGISLWILPVGLTLTAIPSFLDPVLFTGLIIKFFDGGVNYSVQQASREVLYLPIASGVRYRVKPVIDMLGFRLAKTIGGIYIAVLAPLLGVPDLKLNILVLLLIPGWLVLVWQMKRAYSKLLRIKLLRQIKPECLEQPEHATDVLGLLYDEKTFESIKAYLAHRSSYARKLAATAYLLYLRNGKDFETARRAIDRLVQREVLDSSLGTGTESIVYQPNEEVQFLENLIFHEAEKRVQKNESFSSYLENYPDDALMKLGNILNSPENGLEVRRRVVRLLELIPKQETVDLLLTGMANAQDQSFRYLIVKAIDRLHDKNKNLHMNRFLIKTEILKEVTIHQKMHCLQYFYARHTRIAEGENYLGIALKAIQDESLERLFCFLDLLYPHEIIRIIYQRMIEHPSHDALRAHALELLHNTLDTDLRVHIQRILEEREPRRISEKEVVETLRNYFAESSDSWFNLIGGLVVSELKLHERWPALVKYIDDLDGKYTRA